MENLCGIKPYAFEPVYSGDVSDSEDSDLEGNWFWTSRKYRMVWMWSLCVFIWEEMYLLPWVGYLWGKTRDCRCWMCKHNTWTTRILQYGQPPMLHPIACDSLWTNMAPPPSYLLNGSISVNLLSAIIMKVFYERWHWALKRTFLILKVELHFNENTELNMRY